MFAWFTKIREKREKEIAEHVHKEREDCENKEKAAADFGGSYIPLSTGYTVINSEEYVH